MRIQHLKLLNFRNHKKFAADFEKTNLLLGANGSGKTSILEAIFLLSTSKSPRTALDKDLIFNLSQKSNLELTLISSGKEKMIIRLELGRQDIGNKIFSCDGVVIAPKNIVGMFKTVYFSPETLAIINGSPAERRRFIDILLSQISPSYLADLIEYKKILINRNRLLKEIAQKRRDRDEIIFWDTKLVEHGAKIMRRRQEVLSRLSRPFKEYYQAIAKRKKEVPKIRYHPSFILSQGRDIESVFTERLAAEFNFELKYGSTLFGPHRDDLRFLLGNYNAASFCSRGEIRSIVIALKLAEADFMKNETGDNPVILLDDIFSELDEKRAEALGKLVLNNYQVIITSIENNLLDKIKSRKIKIIRLKDPVYV